MHSTSAPSTIGMAVLAAVAWSLLWQGSAFGQRAELERPINLVVQVDDQTRLRGRMTAWDATGFDFTDHEGALHDVTWDRLPVEQVYQIHEGLLRQADARTWLELSARLRMMRDGDAYAERVFTRVHRMDPSLRPAIERVRSGGPIDAPVEAPDAGGHDHSTDSPPSGGGVAAGPRIVGGAQADHWGPQPPERMAAAIERLKAVGEQARAQINPNLTFFETDYFLFYTDLSADEGRRWAGELDRMYNKLCDLFGIARGTNIWMGKCLILIFRSEQDYHAFQAKIHQTNSAGSAGMCHGYGNGDVHVAFYRQPAELIFAHVLVHEAVHGFFHRYRSPVHIPSWINEGLAETIAFELLPKAPVVPNMQQAAKAQMRLRGSTDNMFDAQPIAAWQYGAASSITQFMIKHNRKGYVAFINGIKDGQTWQESLVRNYGVELPRLVRVWGDEDLGIANLRP